MTATENPAEQFKKDWPADLTSDRKRYYPFPYDLLADLPDGTGSAAAKTGIWSSVAAPG